MSDLFIFLHGLAHKSLIFDSFVIVFAKYFQYIVMTYAFMLVLRQLVKEAPPLKPLIFIKAGIKEAFWVSFSTILAISISGILKTMFSIPRPFLDGILPLFNYGGYNSFPSGHATFFAALTVSMFLYHRSRGWWFFVSGIIIGGARVISGIHYPVDIFFGYVLGTAVAAFTHYWVRPFVRKKFLNN